MTLSDLAKYSMARSIARPFCDSKATCYGSVVTNQPIANAHSAAKHWSGIFSTRCQTEI